MEQRDIVVVGAGIVGLTIAYHLAQRNATRRILVLDPLGVGEEATAVAPGGVRQQWSTPINCRMARHSFAFYREADRILEEPRIHLSRGGYLFLAHDEDGWNSLRAAVRVQRAEHVETEELDPDALYDRFAFLAPDDTLRGGTFLQDDGYLDNPRAVVHALERQARRLGVEFRFQAAVSLETVGSRVVGVVTSDGRIAADVVIVAAGVATPGLLGPLGVLCPIEREPKYLLFSQPLGEMFLEPLVIAPHDGVATKQLASGHVMASDLVGTDPDDLYLWRRKIRAFAERAVPQLAMVELGSMSAGYYDSTPDHQGLVARTGIEGLFVAAGMSGHGFMMAPAVAKTMEHLVTGSECPWPLAPLSLERFRGDGKIQPERNVV